MIAFNESAAVSEYDMAIYHRLRGVTLPLVSCQQQSKALGLKLQESGVEVGGF
jgi:hypothetical protein